MKERDFTLGQQVNYTCHMRKKNRSLRYSDVYENGAGVLVGFRTVSDMRLDDEDGYYVSASYRVALVADDLYKVPKKVPIENLFTENPR